MSHRLAVRAASALILLLAGVASAQRLVPGTDPEHPRVKYADSLESVNDRCIVAKRTLSRTVRPIYVNLRPIGFC